MEIPLGFDVAQSAVAEQAGSLVDLTGQLSNRAQNKFASDMQNMQGLAEVTGKVMDEVHRRQGVALDTASIVAASKAETELTESTRDRAITKADLDKFEETIRGSTDGMKKPPGYAVSSSQALRKVRASIESNVAERNFKFLRNKEVVDTSAGIHDLIAAGKFGDAKIAINNASAKSDLFTADQLQSFNDRLTISQTHATLIDLIASGTPTAIENGEAYAMKVLTDPSIDASLRDSIHGSLNALIERVNGDNKLATAAAQKAHLNFLANQHAYRMEWARNGVRNEKTGELDFMTKGELLQLQAAGEFAEQPDKFTALSQAIKTRTAQGESDDQDTRIMLDSLFRDDVTGATSPFAKAAPNVTATRYADAQYPPMANWQTWKPEDQAQLVNLLDNGYVPDQVPALLYGSMSPGSSGFDGAMAMADRLRVESKTYWANGVPANQKNFYNTVLGMRDAGIDVRDAATQYATIANRTKAEKDALYASYRTEGGGTTLAQTNLANQTWLRENLGQQGGALFGGAGVLGEELLSALDQDTTMSAYVSGQFNAMTNHFYMQNGGHYEAARQTALETLGTVVRPSNVNGYTEWMLYAPEWRPGTTVPFAPAEIRAQAEEDMKKLQGWDEAKNTYLLDTEGDHAGMFHLTPTTGWKNGIRVFLWVDRDGNAALQPSGEVATWQPDYEVILAKHKKEEDFRRTVQDALARDYENRVNTVAEKLKANPLYMGNEDYHVVDEAKSRLYRMQNYKKPEEPFVNQYPGMLKSAGDWAAGTLVGEP